MRITIKRERETTMGDHREGKQLLKVLSKNESENKRKFSKIKNQFYQTYKLRMNNVAMNS